jgi:class 3 adenylate cyclase
MDETSAYRIGDAERRQVADLLSKAFSDGRLTLDEFNERVGEAWAAVTRDELDILVADLPPGVRPVTPRPAPAPGAPSYGPPSGGYAAPYPPSGGYAHQRPLPRRRNLVGIMSASRAKGRWNVPPVVSAFAFWGAAIVDLREAIIEWPEVEINAFALMGGVDIIVPPGMDVDLTGFVLMGGATDLTKSGPATAGGPRIRVKAAGMWGGVTVRTLTPGKRWDDKAELERAWAEAEADDNDEDDEADETSVGPQDGDGGARQRGPHGRGHRHGNDRWPSPPAPPGLPRGLQDMLPQMPGPRPAPPRRAGPGRPPWQQEQQPPPRPPQPPPAEAPSPSPSPPPATPAAEPAATPASAQAEAEASPVNGNGVRPTGRVLTMLVSDIVDSTMSAVRMGDQRWIGVLATHDALFREQVRRHHGTEVKHQGDGFLVTFTSARQAVLAGIAIQRAMASHRTAFPENDLHLRLGIHTGEVVEDDGDIFGANVITAVRIAGVARPDEVLVSGLTHDLTESSGDLAFDDGREATLKGISRPSQVYAAAWG